MHNDISSCKRSVKMLCSLSIENKLYTVKLRKQAYGLLFFLSPLDGLVCKIDFFLRLLKWLPKPITSENYTKKLLQ